MALVNTGLRNGGRTTHFRINYDPTLPSALALARGLQAKCESDYQDMATWFGMQLDDLPIDVHIVNQGGGASWSDGITSSPSVTIKPVNGSGAATLTQIRYLLVAEVTEIFMSAQDHGWFAGGDEGSKGEGLSRFLSLQFLLANDLATETPGGFGVTATWLNSARPNFVDRNPDDNRPDIVNGCTTLFLFYLHDQLGYTINQIIAAGASTLGGVYRNLTGRSDGWTAFSALVDSHYPRGRTYNPAAETVFPVPTMITIFSPGTVTTGYTGTGTVGIDRPAAVDLPIRLSSDDTGLITVDGTVIVPAGQLTAQFTVTSTAQPGPFAPKTVGLTAHYAGTTLTTTVQIVPPRLAGLVVTPNNVPAGSGATGTVTLARASLAGDVEIDLLSASPGFATVPPSVTIGQGQLTATFPVTTPRIEIPFSTAVAVLQATYAGSTVTARITVTPTVVAGIIASLTLQPATVTGGGTSRGTVRLERPVPTDTLVGLAAIDAGSGHLPQPGPGSSIASVPASITIPAGSTTGSFPIRTTTVTSGTRRTVTILAGAVRTKYAALTVTG